MPLMKTVGEVSPREKMSGPQQFATCWKRRRLREECLFWCSDRGLQSYWNLDAALRNVAKASPETTENNQLSSVLSLPFIVARGVATSQSFSQPANGSKPGGSIIKRTKFSRDCVCLRGNATGASTESQHVDCGCSRVKEAVTRRPRLLLKGKRTVIWTTSNQGAAIRRVAMPAGEERWR